MSTNTETDLMIGIFDASMLSKYLSEDSWSEV